MAAFSSLYQSGRKWLGLGNSDTDLDTELKAWTNDAYREVVGAFDWETRLGDDTVQTEAKEDTSTLQAAAIGATALTIDDAVWDTSWTGRRIRIGDETYDVSSFGSTTTATLADGLAVAVAAGASYSVYKDQYSLPSDLDKMIGVYPSVTSYPALIRLARDQMMSLKSAYYAPQDYPRHYAIVGTDSSGYQEIMVDPIPASRMNLRMVYERSVTELSGDSDIPVLLPLHTHYLISKRVRCYCYEFDRAQESIMLMDRAMKDFHHCLALEINRSRQNTARVRLDGETFGGSRHDWLSDLISRENY